MRTNPNEKLRKKIRWIKAMTIYDSIIVINADNINKLEKFYGQMTIDQITEAVNHHLSIALKEMEQRGTRQRNELVLARMKIDGISEKDISTEY